MAEHDEGTATSSKDDVGSEHARGAGACLHLVVVWSRHEPERLGECSAVSRDAILGRSSETSPGDPTKLEFARARPGSTTPMGFLGSPTLSRKQWILSASETSLRVENVGKRDLLHNGVATRSCSAKPGDTVGVDGVVLFLVERRPRILPPQEYDDFPFGRADADHLVGETPEFWRVRREIALLAQNPGHTLLLGDAGTGKGLCAQAIHRRSPRAHTALVSLDTATIPETLVEAELFGEAGKSPHTGIPPRQGLLDLANHGILFLDEIDELEPRKQATLLRVLDSGEYQRLGEDRIRRSDVRVVAATNRAPEQMTPDVMARFPERLSLPSLNARRADIPLLIRAILEADAKRAGRDPRELSLALCDALVRHEYSRNFRELERLVRAAMDHSDSDILDLTDGLRAEIL